MKKFKLFFMLIVVLGLLVACGSNNDADSNKGNTNNSSNSNEQGEKVLNVGYYSDASNYDPLLASSGGDETILYFLYDNLVDYDENFEPVPALAESWENPDDKTWIMHLRDDVKFHDGTDFNAEAVKFNIDRANSEDSNKSDLSAIESVDVTDEYTVTLNLNEPNSGLLQALMTAAGMMVSPTAIEEYGEEYNNNPVGTGPYTIANRNPDSEINFEKNENYWQEGRPLIDKVNLKVMEESTRVNALKAGEIDIIAPVSSANKQPLESENNVKIDSAPSLNFQYIFINTALAPMDNADIRKAVQYAVNREQLVEAIQFGDGEPAYGVFPKEHLASLKDTEISYDPEKAKKLVEESGVDNPTLDMLVKPDAFDVRIAEAVQAQLGEVGIKVNIHPTEVTKLVELAFSKAEYPATLARAAGRPDPNALLSLYYEEKSFYNPGRFVSKDLSNLIKQASEETDYDKRMELISKSNRIVFEEEAMGIPLFFEPMTVAFNEKVKGFQAHQYGKPRFEALDIE